MTVPAFTSHLVVQYLDHMGIDLSVVSAAREFAERLAKLAHSFFPESWEALAGWKP